MLCLSPSGNGTHSDTTGSSQKPQTQPVRKTHDDDGPTSKRSNESLSSSDSQKSNYVLEVLRTFNIKHIKTVSDVVMEGVEGKPLDDKTYLMERIIQLAADLPVESRTSATLTNAFLNQLWTDLQHPPHSYLGTEYIYRKADGSNNNILWPHLGAARQPYARTVRPRLMQPVARPDPGLIFDSLLARKKFTPHPNKISSVLFYLASIIIHDIFHTSHQDYSISETSSYLDLAPLYGNSVAEQHSVRTLKDGKLKPDCFFDRRILGFPPGVGVLLIMFNRFHNHVVEHLASIDEGGRFSSILNPRGKPRPENAEELYDEALFQTARLITTGLYINIILKDYVRTILNLNRVDSHWNLDPRSEEGKALLGHKIPEATGNSVSAEFNLVYRWHSCVSEKDEQWTKDVYTKLFGTTQSTQPLGDFLRKLGEWAQKLPVDILQRDFAGLERSSDGKYSDDKLSAIWTASVQDVAGSFGAHHVPEVLRNVEILGMIQSRSWNLASLNEFREYFKLAPHKSFESINPDPLVAEQLRRLYGHPDNVEIYPGIVVEAAKEPRLPGSGLCTNFTISRAVLSDAVALVRGDRFYTVDYTPQVLTNFGFHEAGYDPAINYGCVFYKLVLNAFPNNFKQNSIYAHYPLVVPDENKAILTRLKKADLYNFEKPVEVSAVVTLTSQQTINSVICNTTDFHPTWDPQIFSPTRGPGKAEHQHPLLAQQLLENKGLASATASFYKDAIASLLKSEAYQVASIHQVDILRDVFNIAHARFAANLFLLPLSPHEHSKDRYNEVDLISVLSAVYSSVSAEHGPARRFTITKTKQKEIRQLAERIQDEVDSVVKGSFGLHSHSTVQLRSLAVQAVQAVSRNGLSVSDIVWTQILPLAARLFVTQSRFFAENLDHFLSAGQGQAQQLVDENATALPEKIQDYISETSGKQQSTPVSKKAVVSATIQDGERQVEILPGQLVLCDVVSHPSSVRVGFNLLLTTRLQTRGEKAQDSIHGAELSLEKKLGEAGLGAAIECLLGLTKVSRAARPTGQLRKIKIGNTVKYLNVEESKTVLYPGSLKIDWKG